VCLVYTACLYISYCDARERGSAYARTVRLSKSQVENAMGAQSISVTKRVKNMTSLKRRFRGSAGCAARYSDV